MENNNKYLFEVSWEVCNKVGGIYTVIASKIKEATKAFGDNYCLIGPWLNDTDDFVEEKGTELTNIYHKLETLGIQSKIGRWNVPEAPRVVLIRFDNAIDKDKLLFELWEEFGVDSMKGGWDYIEPVVFSTVAGKVIEALSSFYEEKKIIAHFHEWMTGAGLLYLKKNAPHISTVFTTHATILGRSMAGNGIDIYHSFETLNPNEEAEKFNVSAKYYMEKTAAQHADSFTTVSDVTAIEAKHILHVNIDKVLPNGFDVRNKPNRTDRPDYFQKNREKLLDIASRFLQKEIRSEETFIISTSGRYEFHNKGLDVLIEALAEIRNENLNLKKDILFFFLVLAGSEETTISGNKEFMTRYSQVSTHPLWNPASDPIANNCRAKDLQNNEDDKVNVIFIPIYLTGNDGLINMEYYEALSGCDLSIYPSYYEPWGYTPLESIAFSVPTITTDLAGFGQWAKGIETQNTVSVIDRLENDDNYVVQKIREKILEFVNMDEQELKTVQSNAFQIALQAEWEFFYVNYLQAYNLAIKKNKSTIGLRKKVDDKTITIFGADSIRPRFRSLTIKSTIPPEIENLRKLAYNLWWSWTPDAYELFNHLDPVFYDATGHNPVGMIESLPYERFQEVAASDSYKKLYENVIKEFEKYINQKTSLVNTKGFITKERPVAYFSMEYGLHESLPVYSGGLGILSGDHIKSASDINLNLIGVGLLYKKGYFKQGISKEGNQKVDYFNNDFYRMPLEEVKKNGKNVIVKVDFPGRKVYAKAWRINVGRTPVYVLDTDILENSPSDRGITGMLYGGGKKIRIEQEIILGIGGVKLLQELNITPSVYHMNEGHSGFLILQRLINQMKYNELDFETALEVIRASTVFTTHTPVPAGNEVFDLRLVESYLRDYVKNNGLSWNRVCELANRSTEGGGNYEMTVLSLKNTYKRNGVSSLHGVVSRNMWAHLWQGFLIEELPIKHITNGVHLGSWLSTEMKKLFSKYITIDYNKHVTKKELWEKVYKIPAKELWHAHTTLKNRFFNYIKEKITENWIREGESPSLLDRFLMKLSPAPLTIGFARRFATYKRATLLFNDLERLKKILNNPKYPVQFIFAGKSHPDDVEGAGLIRQIVELSKSEDFLGKIIFVEDYDIKLARKLVCSVDVWLNNPIRPYEASGTSGMKAGMNGVLNASILDGWWDEGYNSENGWAIGEGQQLKNTQTQNIVDSDSLYDLLESEIVPAYYQRNSTGIPEKWIKMMKESIVTISTQFNTHRMLFDYVDQMYLPAAKRHKLLTGNNFEKADELSEWKKSIRNRFSSIHIENITIKGSKDEYLNLDDSLTMNLSMNKGKVSTEEINIELMIIPDMSGDIITFKGEEKIHDEEIEIFPFKLVSEKDENLTFSCKYKAGKSGKFKYGIRVLPKHPLMANSIDLNLIYWA